MNIISLTTYDEGSSKSIDIGTGKSGPAGVDAVIQYKDFYMNRRDLLDTILITNIDGIADADIRDSREVNPAQDGETAFASYYGGRTIVLSGLIRAFTLNKLRDLQQDLRQAFSDISTENKLVIHSSYREPTPGAEVVITSKQIYCKKNQSLVMAEAQRNFAWERDFQVTLRASKPFFVSTIPKDEEIIFGPGSVTGTLENGGNYKAQPVITITGPVTNPVITNDTNGQTITLTSVDTGELVVIDTAERKMVNQLGANAFNRLNVSSDWLVLEGGSNQISISSSFYVAPARVNIAFGDTYS